MIHFVLFPGLVSNDIQENVDRRIAVLGGWAVTVLGKHSGRGPEKDDKGEAVKRGKVTVGEIGGWETCCIGMRDVSAVSCAERLGDKLTAPGRGE